MQSLFSARPLPDQEDWKGPGRPPWGVGQELLQGQNVAQAGPELDLNRNKGFFFCLPQSPWWFLSHLFLCFQVQGHSFEFKATDSSFVSFYSLKFWEACLPGAMILLVRSWLSHRGKHRSICSRGYLRSVEGSKPFVNAV